MTKKLFGGFILATLAICNVSAKDYIVSTDNTSMIITAEEGKTAKFRYYGPKVAAGDVKSLYLAGVMNNSDAYPTFGGNTIGNKAVWVTQPDGSMSLDLAVVSVNEYDTDEAKVTEILQRDKEYPFEVKLIYKAYKNSDIIGSSVEMTNKAKKPVMLYKFASSFLPVKRADNYFVHYHGSWAAENFEHTDKLTGGQLSVSSTEGVRNTRYENPSFMITLNGRPQEESGDIIGGTLVYTGNYKITTITNNWGVDVVSGMNEENSHYKLEAKEVFTTPELTTTFSSTGKGGVSRAFHKWARQYGVHNADRERDILLNSWEGVFFEINQGEMNDMIKSIADMGGELFVMDDGWFGDKYPRDNGKTSLGDWVVAKNKLPEGVEGLIETAKANGIKFGIWIEPEMVNTKSELFEKHPEWGMYFDNRPMTLDRGGTQMTLDLSNPEVQDFVFGVVDDLMTKYPELAYIKWDANCAMGMYNSHYLPKDKQSHLNIAYHRGLKSVLDRVRAKYPDLVMQACASGGGRMTYGYLDYFDEFWTSDNTDALQRVYMQWSASSFYPAIAMASHINELTNHITGRVAPIKFRADVAMSGRLGIEIQPKDMTAEDKEFVRRAMSSYKDVRHIVQFGDLYRLISPYDNYNIASLMYATESKDEAVLFVYDMESMINPNVPNVKLSGVDPNKNYKITDLTPVDPAKPCQYNGRVVSGKVLKEVGLSVYNTFFFDKTGHNSLALKLEAVE